MSSVQIEVLNSQTVKTNPAHHKTSVKSSNTSNPKRKNKHDRSSRKRSKSFSGCGIMINQKPVLPSKFLLGGNIKDPLNLNSLQDEEINRAMNAVTPKSSPVPTPPRKKGQIEVIIPKNIHDPLNLIDCDDDAKYEQQLCSPIKKSKKKRLKKRRTVSVTIDMSDITADISSTTEAKTPESSADSARIPEIPDILDPIGVGDTSSPKPKPKLDLSIDLSASCASTLSMVKKDGVVPAAIKKDKNKRKSDEHHHGLKKFKNNSMDKIVSPVVPQPGAWLKRSTSVNKWPKPRQQCKPQDATLPHFKEKDKQFQYGNYNRYYGYRNPHNETDHRIKVFFHHPYLFDNKDILDIGCNIGHVTLSVARDFRAKSILGIDIDQKLISIARKNVKHYVKKEDTSPSPVRAEEGQVDSGKRKEHNSIKSSEFFPISMPILYGSIDVPGFTDTHNKSRGFPNNVTFKYCNYILEDDNLLALEQPQFDVILCLSVTKWFHLNWGDAGLKQTFRRMYAQLRPGGKLILEPQNWASYKSKKKLTETIYQNYNSIEFFPEKFREYLLSPAVGFAKGEILGYPFHQVKGFRRPIQVFTKSTMFPSERVEATPHNSTPSIGGGTSFDTCRTKTEKYEGQTQGPCIEHVYTDIFDCRFCGSIDDNQDINNKPGEEFNKKIDPSKMKEKTNVREEDSPCFPTQDIDGEKSESQEVWQDNT